jgi:hypothetical protein
MDLRRRYPQLTFAFAGGLVFGSNGGGEAFVFDARGEVLMVPWIAAPEDAIPQGSFTSFLRRLETGTTFTRPG